ncbi:MAG: dephospho-CoA kinase [Kiritimatiellae bacterium]|nr:dephospho-CoA kinase [Kiritimatiellia bacterium]
MTFSRPSSTPGRMRRIALTGGIACGKSLAGRALRAEGIPVCDADDLAHAAMQPGTATHRGVVRAFGKDILDGQGRIDRAHLGRIVFSDDRQRARLNAIVHPAVRRAYERWLRERRQAGDRVAVVIIPLLFEAGMERGWDEIICVISPRDQIIRRLRARGLSQRAAIARIRAQWPLRKKARQSTHLWINDGSQAAFTRMVRRTARRWRTL